jgi:hypothetical protein
MNSSQPAARAQRWKKLRTYSTMLLLGDRTYAVARGVPRLRQYGTLPACVLQANERAPPAAA